MSKHKFNIILDLDETLLSTVDIKDKNDTKGVNDLDALQMKTEFKFYDFLITPRPYLQDFLKFLFTNFNVSIWTAASKDYACYIVDNLITPAKSNRKLTCLFFDMHRNISEKIYNAPKKLELLWSHFNLYDDFNEKNTIIIDDLQDVKKSQPSSTYQIPAFDVRKAGYENDRELKKLKKLLSENLVGLNQSSSLARDSARKKITMQTARFSKQ